VVVVGIEHAAAAFESGLVLDRVEALKTGCVSDNPAAVAPWLHPWSTVWRRLTPTGLSTAVDRPLEMAMSKHHDADTGTNTLVRKLAGWRSELAMVSSLSEDS